MSGHDGMTRLGPGIYDDNHGGLHVDVAEALEHLGKPYTPENEEALMVEIRRVAREHGLPLSEQDG